MGDYGYGNQYSTTSYGAQGGAGDGGFVASGSQEQTGANRNYGDDTLRPYTIKQLNDAELPHPDAKFRIDNVEVSQLTFVGQVRSISARTTNYIYKIDDGTGTIEVKQWIDPDANSEGADGNKTQVTENSYARVFGNLKQFDQKRHIGARPGGIRPIENHDEVHCHMLEAAMVHLQMTRGPPDQQKGGDQNGMYGAAQTNGYSGAQAKDTGAGGRPLPPGLSAAAKRVYNCLATTQQTNEGLHMQDIASRLNMDMTQVGGAGDELLGHGLVYTTVDDQTWAVLDDI